MKAYIDQIVNDQPRQIIPRQPYRRPPITRPSPRKTPKDTIFEETMRKLREMSK